MKASSDHKGKGKETMGTWKRGERSWGKVKGVKGIGQRGRGIRSWGVGKGKGERGWG